MRCKSELAAMVTAVLLAATAVKADGWLTYQNDRYGTTIDYPDLFKMQPPPGSDDGREFKSPDGADFVVSAFYFALDLTVANTAISSSRISIAVLPSLMNRAARIGSSFPERWATRFFMKSIDCRTA